MLIKLGKYLRVAGFDAEWDLGLRTHELILKANAEGRIFVTRNKHLAHRYPEPRQVVLLRSTDPVEQYRALLSELRMEAQSVFFSKCIKCNVRLEEVADKSAIESKVHPNVFARFEHFFTCSGCGTVFWKGSHVRNTCRKLGVESVDEMGG